MSPKTTEQKKSCPLDTTLNSDPTLLLYSYSTISNANFQEILLKSTSSFTGTNELVELLSNNQDVFLFIRQLTQLLNQLSYFQLQKDQWTYYDDLGMTQGIWHGRVSKKMATVNSMCYTYGRSKVLIKQRKQKYEKQFQQIQNELDEFVKKAPPQLHVDNSTIINIINSLIYKDQYQLRVELERRRIMLHFDAKEHQLVNDFYKSKPRKSEVSRHITQSDLIFSIQIHSAKIIWKLINQEQTIRGEIALFQQWLSMQTTGTPCTFPDIELTHINPILTQVLLQLNQSFNNNLGNQPTDCLNQLRNTIFQQTLTKAEHIAYTYSQKVIHEKNKLDRTKSNHKNIMSFENMLKIVNQREINMVHRAQHQIHYHMRRLSP